MNLRPGKHPLVMAVHYLCIYYVCASIVLGASGRFDFPERVPITSLFIPSGIFLLDSKSWAAAPNLWIAAMVIQLLLIATLTYLQYRRIQSLQPTPQS